MFGGGRRGASDSSVWREGGGVSQQEPVVNSLLCLYFSKLAAMNLRGLTAF